MTAKCPILCFEDGKKLSCDTPCGQDKLSIGACTCDNINRERERAGRSVCLSPYLTEE